MPKLILNDIGTSFQSKQALNENFRLIEQALENTVSRDGSQPNQMNGDFDANGNDLINIGKLFTNGLIYRGLDVSDALFYFTENGEELIDSLPVILNARSDVLASQLSIENIEDNIEQIENNVVFLDARTAVNAQSAQSDANIAVTVKNELQNAFSEVQTISQGILEAQAQANAVLGLGLGNAVITADGDLILTVYDGYFDNVAINNDGELILEWVV